MKKCWSCGTTKGLKSIWLEDEETTNHCACNKCFFDNELENESDVTRENWDLYDYNWNLKKELAS